MGNPNTPSTGPSASLLGSLHPKGTLVAVTAPALHGRRGLKGLGKAAAPVARVEVSKRSPEITTCPFRHSFLGCAELQLQPVRGKKEIRQEAFGETSKEQSRAGQITPRSTASSKD